MKTIFVDDRKKSTSNLKKQCPKSILFANKYFSHIHNIHMMFAFIEKQKKKKKKKKKPAMQFEPFH